MQHHQKEEDQERIFLTFPEKPPDGAGAESMKVYKTQMTQRLKYIKSQMRLEGMSDAEISKDINS